MTDFPVLRTLAEAAKAGMPQYSASDGRWEVAFTSSGDPYVGEAGRDDFLFAVAKLGGSPADEGRARAEYIAAADPATILDLLDELALLRETLRRHVADYGPEGGCNPECDCSHGQARRLLEREGSTT